MPIETTCGQCGSKLRAPDSAAGKSARCPSCQATVEVPVIVAEAIESPFGRDFKPMQRPHRPRRPPPDIGQDAAIRMLLPVGRSALAIAAGYMGLFSLLILPAPLALLLGALAILDIRKHPEKHGMGRAIFGLVMGTLGTLVLLSAVVALIAEQARGR